MDVDFLLETLGYRNFATLHHGIKTLDNDTKHDVINFSVTKPNFSTVFEGPIINSSLKS